eukprot:CAMPEP_0174717934 /NCGR_PEP_ID=MMETSP1094-20130205/27573_1 /TAXON_ID=156173 /ORGANISM="Chrysochromulina brevifilum, Strain UTEX LB 985" /LENGTH=120 /DNA_ID=CAMNT_0015917939 /DNA_START=11 /DNA_END=373 /DNA_ORIENTATION=-
MALDSEELMQLPLLGDFFRDRVAQMPSLVEGDVFVPPFGAITPQRHYFLFGQPIPLANLSANDAEGIAAVYAELRTAVESGMHALLDEVRPLDPFRELGKRAAWEALNGVQAPAPLDSTT